MGKALSTHTFNPILLVRREAGMIGSGSKYESELTSSTMATQRKHRGQQEAWESFMQRIEWG